MKRNFLTAVWFTLVTTLLLGVLYPLAITGLSQMLFPKQANGQLTERNGKLVGSAIIGQAFTGPRLFSHAPIKCRDGLRRFVEQRVQSGSDQQAAD
jgi:potassium-transporting ATPase KdpC subunit